MILTLLTVLLFLLSVTFAILYFTKKCADSEKYRDDLKQVLKENKFTDKAAECFIDDFEKKTNGNIDSMVGTISLMCAESSRNSESANKLNSEPNSKPNSNNTHNKYVLLSETCKKYVGPFLDNAKTLKDNCDK